MALQADRVYCGAIEQARVRSAVREMACDAAFGFDDRMLISKRSAFFHVALGADQVLLRRGAEVLLVKCSVRIVAIGALDQPFLHFVMEGHVELRLGVGVALEAEVGLSDLQLVLLVLTAVNAVAADAAYVRFSVCRALEVGVVALVAGEALLVDFLGSSLRGIEDLGDIAAAIDVCFARPVAAFAGDAGFAMRLSQLGVRVRAESFCDFFVAGRAGLLADEVSRRGCGLTCFRAQLDLLPLPELRMRRAEKRTTTSKSRNETSNAGFDPRSSESAAFAFLALSLCIKTTLVSPVAGFGADVRHFLPLAFLRLSSFGHFGRKRAFCVEHHLMGAIVSVPARQFR